MAITGIGYGRTFVYEAQKRVNAGDVQSAQGSATETAESRFAESIEELAKEDNTVKTPVTRGVQLARHIEGKDKVPYGEMAEDGVIEYNGVTFVCDYEHNRLTLGDTTNKEDCINIPLSGGGSLLVNRDNIDALSKAIGMFRPEDVKRILEALAKDNKIQQMKKELAEVKKQLIAVKVQELLQKEAAVIAYDGEDANDIRTAAQAMMNQVEGNKVIYMASGDAIHFAIVSGKNEARTILEAIKASFDVTGGGSFKIVTAKAEVGKDAFLEALAKIVS